MENVTERIQAIVNDREHGSRWLVREAILFLLELARAPYSSSQEHVHILAMSAYQIAQARPAMAALASAMSQIISVYENGPGAMVEEAQNVLASYMSAPAQIIEYARPLIKGQVLTCSLSGTVMDVLLACRERLERVVVLEGRPNYEGRETARQLSAEGIQAILVTDAQADIFLPQCHSVVVGADSVLVNGDVLNKAGTALLAWAAHGRGIPLYVLCETLKISARRWYEHDPGRLAENLVLLEEKEAGEVYCDVQDNLIVRNFYFDHTPYRLIKGIITECGVMDRRLIRDIAVRARSNLRQLVRLQT